MMNNEKEKDAIDASKLDEILPKYEPLKLNGINLAQNYVSAFNTGMNIYQCVNQLQGYIEWVVKAVNDVVKLWNKQVGESIDQSKAIVRETTTEQFNTEWTNKQPELIEQVNTLTTNQFNEDWGVLENRINTTLETQNTNIQNIQNEQNELETNTNNNINVQNTKINSIQTQQTNLSNQQTTLSNRMDTFTSLSEGSTTGDAELKDIRVGANGVTYHNAGDAVRGQYSQLKEDIVDLNEVVVSLKIDEEIATKDNIVGVETTLEGNHYNTSADFSGIKGFTNGRHYKMVFVPNTSGTFTFKTLLNGSWIETIKPTTVILENEKCVIDIPSTIDFSIANKRLCILNGGGYVVNANIYVYDVTNVNEDILKNVDFTTCANPVVYQSLNIPQKTFKNWLIAENILYGKDASFLGDSLTTEGSGSQYIGYVKDGLGLSNTHNCGIGGTRVSSGDETDKSFWTNNRVNSLSLSSDCLFIMGGTNDAPYTTVQDSDFTIDNHDINNFVGAYNVLISKVLYKYLKLSSGYYSDIDYSGLTQVEEAKPYFRIILITPPKRFDSLSNLQKVENFADYVIRIAEMWGIPVCDVNHQMNMNIINKASYWTHQTEPDWVHFDSNAHRELANIVIGKVKTLN